MQKSFIIVLLLLLSFQLVGQNVNGSAYSYFGIGDIYQKGFGQQMITGGTGIASRNPLSLNNINPASYSSFKRINTITEWGLNVSTGTSKEGDQTSYQSEMQFPYLAMGFKTGKNSGASFGLRKFSNVNYSILGESSFSGVNGDYIIDYQGSGGLNEVYFGFAREFWNTVSVGAHGSYIFGTLQNDQKIISSQLGYNIGIDDQLFLNSFNYDLGIQIKIPVNRSEVILGAIYSPGTTLNEDRELIVSNLDPSTLEPYDTVTIEDIDEIGYSLPQSFGAGISWNLRDLITISGDYNLQLWSDSDISGQGYQLTNSHRWSFGVERQPNYNEEGWFNRINYGFGVFRQDSYLILEDEQIVSRGFTGGFGFPVRNKAMIRFIYEYTNRGQDLGDFYKDNYSKFSLSVSLLDVWFTKVRYR